MDDANPRAPTYQKKVYTVIPHVQLLHGEFKVLATSPDEAFAYVRRKKIRPNLLVTGEVW